MGLFWWVELLLVSVPESGACLDDCVLPWTIVRDAYWSRYPRPRKYNRVLCLLNHPSKIISLLLNLPVRVNDFFNMSRLSQTLHHPQRNSVLITLPMILNINFWLDYKNLLQIGINYQERQLLTLVLSCDKIPSTLLEHSFSYLLSIGMSPVFVLLRLVNGLLVDD